MLPVRADEGFDLGVDFGLPAAVEHTEMANFEPVAVRLLPQRYRHRDHYSSLRLQIEAAIRSIAFSG